MDREIESKGRTAARDAINEYESTSLLDDTIGGGQAKTGPFKFSI